MKIKILIDSVVLLSSLTGIGKYTNEVAKYLEKENDLDMNYFYGYYSKKRIKCGEMSQVKSLKAFLSNVSLLKKVSRKILIIISQVFATKYDLYWCPNFIPLASTKASKIVTTVHDLSFYIYPQWHPEERLHYINNYFFKNVQKSDWIITGSEFSKKEIVEYLGFDEEKITVIYHGVDQELYKVYDKNILKVTKKKLELADDFFLFVGSIEPRKNLLNLLKTYHILPDSIKKKYPLVLVGFKGWNNDDVMKEIEKEKNNIRYLGYLNDEELAHVYNLASLFIYPSLYEGFGIPPLEAMACGTAVISSDAASLPEVCDDAAIYINPNDYMDIAKKIELLVANQDKMNELISKGLKRVKNFTWEKSAKKHLKVFNKVMRK
jgi:glycosyltransferase involved in cell wall biosynthesis